MKYVFGFIVIMVTVGGRIGWVTAEPVTALSCVLRPSVDIDLASPIAGVIQTIPVRRGDLVKAGQVLVELHDEIEQAELKLKQFQADYGERTITRNQQLYENNLLSEQERDEVVVNNRLYTHEAALIRARIAQKRIRSPVTGVVVDRMRDPGESVGEGAILRLAQLDPLHIDAVFPSQRFGHIQLGQSVDMQIVGLEGKRVKGTVIVVDPVIDPASGTFSVRMKLDNPGNATPSGLKCVVNL